MAGNTIKEFLVGIGFKVDDQGLNNFEGKVKAFSMKTAAAVAAVAAGFYAVGKAVTDTVNKFDELGDAANRVGTTPHELEKFAYAAELTGSTMDVAKASMENFGRRVGEVAMGVGRSVVIFENLGISVRDADGQMRDTADILGEVGSKIKDLDRSEQLNILNKLGLDSTLVETLTTDISALTAEFDELYQANNTNLSTSAESAGAFNDALFRLRYSFGTFKNALFGEVMAPMADAMESMTKRFVEFMKGAMEVARPFFKAVSGLVAGLVKIFARVGQGVGALISAVVKPFAWFFSILPNWVKVLGGLTAGWIALNAAFAASPVGMVIALGLAIAALVDDFLVWKEGGQSFIDWSAWEPAIAAATEAVGNLVQFFRDLTGAVFGLIDGLVKLFSGDTDGAFKAWGDSIESVRHAVESLFGWLTKTQEFLGNVLGGAASWLKTGLNKVGITAFDNFLPAGDSKVLADVKGGGQTNNVQVKTDIVVQGAANPETTASIVGANEKKVIQAAIRNGAQGVH